MKPSPELLAELSPNALGAVRFRTSRREKGAVTASRAGTPARRSTRNGFPPDGQKRPIIKVIAHGSGRTHSREAADALRWSGLRITRRAVDPNQSNRETLQRLERLRRQVQNQGRALQDLIRYAHSLRAQCDQIRVRESLLPDGAHRPRLECTPQIRAGPDRSAPPSPRQHGPTGDDQRD